MTLTCTPGANMSINLKSRIEREAPRPYASALGSSVPRCEAVVTLWARCKRCEVAPLDWRGLDEAIGLLDVFEHDVPPIVSHGVCQDCHLARLKGMRKTDYELNAGDCFLA